MSEAVQTGATLQTFLSTEQGRDHYNLTTRDSLLATPLDTELAENGIARIHMPLRDVDFEELMQAYENCLDDCPDILGQTYYLLDRRFGNEVGHVRKEQKIDARTGRQVADSKNFIHLTEGGTERWREQFSLGPIALRNFIETGEEIHQAMIGVARQQFEQIEETHPNRSAAYFTGIDGKPASRTFLRLLSYDGYKPAENMGEVAKPHFDIGALTIQAYADAPGFWAAPDGVHGERTHHDTSDGEAYFFAGIGHRKLYGRNDRFQPLWHGVDRIIPKGIESVPKRHTAVMFIDAPEIDYNVRIEDTLPYITLTGDGAKIARTLERTTDDEQVA